MKKFITLALALVLALSTTVCAFALEAPATGLGSGDQTIAVSGTYEGDPADDKVSVEISWNSATYKYSVVKTWNPSTHRDDERGSWTQTQSGTDFTVTVTNHSNCSVWISSSVAPAAGMTNVELTKTAEEELTASTVNTAAGEEDNSTQQAYVTSVNGATLAGSISANGTIATITVKIATSASTGV